jgi:signal transduction histidine kinase
VLVINLQQQIEMANPSATRLLGALPAVSSSGSQAKWQPPAPLRQPLLDTLQNQQEYLPESFDRALAMRVEEETRFFLPRMVPIRDQQGITRGAAILLQDITRFRLLDEVKSNLVATVSHELKTPLTSIRLALHLLLEDSTGPLLPKQLELLIDARDNAERILVMINNLLDLARLEQGSGQLQLQPTQPLVLLRTMADSFRPRATEQGIEFTLELPPDLPKVAVDEYQLQHAIQNLLENSLTYTPHGGRITLSAQPNDGNIMFSVADTGRGIPPEYQQSVFEKYFRVPGSSAPGGSGLGLAIVREIITAHGGTVECESKPGQKTVFRIFLPILKTTGLAPAIGSVVAGAQRPLA